MLPLRPALRLSLFAAALVAANLAHAEVPAGAPFTPEQQHVIQQLSASEVHRLTPQIASEALVIVAKTTEGQTLQVAKEALEVGRKSVDWWLSNISVWLGGLGLLIAVAGIGIPLWMGRKQKAEWQEKLKQLTLKLQEAETAQQQAEAAQQKAEQHAQEIETLLVHARDKTSLIPNAETITGQLSADVLEKLRKEKPPQVVKLIEQAWDAHRRKDWKTAKPLWGLLSLIEGHDSNVWFNLGFTLVHINPDWKIVASCFERSHLLDPNSVALSNWGNALDELAKSLSGKDQEQCFAEACDKYSEATRIKPDDADPFYNWGNTLCNWGAILSGEEQLQCFAEAGVKYAEAVRIKLDYTAAYQNWGNALFAQAINQSSDAQQRTFGEACAKYAEANRINPDDSDFYHNWAMALEFWAKTLSGEERDAKLAEAASYQLRAQELKEKAKLATSA